MSRIESVFSSLARASFAATCENVSAGSSSIGGSTFHCNFSEPRKHPGRLLHPVHGGPWVKRGDWGHALRPGPAAVKTEGIEPGMGLVLWLEEGYADCLEGYGFDESTTGIDPETMGFEISPSTGSTQIQKPKS
jgi:hypothetical protein